MRFDIYISERPEVLHALQFAEQYGIVEYKVDGHTMVYKKSYPAAGSDKRYTVKHEIDLRTMTETTTMMKRYDRKGELNR